MMPEMRRAGAEIVLVNHIQHRMGRRNRQRVTCVGSAKSARGRRIHYLRPARDGRERHPARQAFRHSDQIGLHAVVFHGEQLAGTGEAGLHFVGNQ